MRNSRLNKEQKDKLSEALKQLDLTTKCSVYHEAEEAVSSGEYPYTTSEYFYDQLLINQDSTVYRIYRRQIKRKEKE